MIEMTRTSPLIRCSVFAACLLFPLASKAAGVSVEAASHSELDSAKIPYQDGVKAMSAGQFEQAADKFRESFNIVASPNSQLMLGRALIKLNRLMDAYRELESALTRATDLAATQPKYQKTAESAKRELQDLKSELAFVTVIPGTEVILGGRKLSPADWGKPQAMMPGRTKVEIVASDGRTREKNLRLEPGETKVLTADFSSSSSHVSRGAEQAKDEESADDTDSGSRRSISRRTIGYVAGGVGIAGVIGFAGAALYANGTFGTPKDDCNKGTNSRLCSRTDLNNAESKGTLMGVGYTMLGVGVVGLGLGTYLVLTDRTAASSGMNHTSPRMTAIAVGPGSVALSGSF